jgi:LacI family transcriptional regulator
MPKVPHVALLIETSRTYGRGLLRGIRRYMAEHGPWSVYVESRGLDRRPPPWLANWKGDGIITRTFSQEAADVISQLSVPTIELRATKLDHDFPFVGIDNRALGQIVADHLLERGFRHFGCYKLTTESFFEERAVNFVASTEAAGFDCAVYGAEGQGATPEKWEEQQRRLCEWLASLPKPVGILACNDQLGFWLLDACTRAGLAVPDEVAVIGVENDESLCGMSTPPMSSVRIDGERVGYEAARLLDQMMQGGDKPSPETLFPFDGIVTRKSSDVICVDDEVVAKAIQFIRDNAYEDLRVEQVAKEIYVSRSVLERRMRAAIGRSPKSEIIRARLQLVQDYLIDTDLPLSDIAERVNFQHPQYMSELFKKKIGQTPGAYRQSFRRPVD